ncbi:hypothetical protein BBP40_010960 [Aspergillus hancockii]|nr:hypothetical protein BBP40_010960 [Aspergillus hancockii]
MEGTPTTACGGTRETGCEQTSSGTLVNATQEAPQPDHEPSTRPRLPVPLLARARVAEVYGSHGVDTTASFKNFEELGQILESSGITARHSGVSTPYNLLLSITSEVRELRKVCDEQVRQAASVSAAMQQQNELLARQLEESRLQNDTLAALLRALDRPMSIGAASPAIPSTPSGRRTAAAIERTYYCEGEKVGTGPGFVAVFLLQMINVVTDEYMHSVYPSVTNDNPLSFKELRHGLWPILLTRNVKR